MSIIQTIIDSKQAEQTISPCISQITHDELPILKINHKNCLAAIALQGAHLLFWQPKQTATPVLWLSDNTPFKHGVAIRGGVPICWPWFSELGGVPMHGFARLLAWQLIAHHETEDNVTLTLGLTQSSATASYWPHAFSLTLTVTLGKTCYLQLDSQGDFTITTALHSYFNVHDIATTTVSGLGRDYFEKLATRNVPLVQGSQTFNQEVDRIYLQPEPISIIDDGHRKIKISHRNASDVVTWNPGPIKSKAMKDMPDQGYKTMVCVETARINHPITSTRLEKSQLATLIELI